MTAETDDLVETFVAALRDQNAAIFAGAGLSVPAGFVNWKKLMQSVASDLGLDVDKEHDLIALAQYHKNERGGRHKINQLIVTDLTKRAVLTENHKILARLPVQTFWTTNYDRLIEEALGQEGKTPDVKITKENLAHNVPRRNAVVYKMHGDVQHPDQAVITKDDYETYNEKRQLFSTALQGDLVSKTFLFLGFSFSDPNLDYVLGRIRVLLGENRRDHYCVLRKVQRKDFRSRSDFIYAQTKQQLQVRDLSRYGIIAVLVDSYQELTGLLKRIEKRYLRNTVFISGSAEVFQPWSEAEATDFIERLASSLIRAGFQIVSGFGLGVGSSVINGVLRELDSEKTKSLDDRLILRPFPQYSLNSAARQASWRRYREEMIPHAGIAIFLFGNKKGGDGSIRNAEGVVEEFQIAKEQGLAVVPIGATGYASKELYIQVRKSFKEYYGSARGLKKEFLALDRTPSAKGELVERIVSFAEKLRQQKS